MTGNLQPLLFGLAAFYLNWLALMVFGKFAQTALRHWPMAPAVVENKPPRPT